MRRLKAPALLLAFFLTLSACGGESDAPPRDGDGGDAAVYDCGGLQIALPSEYLDLLRVDTDFPDAGEGWRPLISVFENASYEAAMEEYGGGGGFLFGFLVMDQAAFEQHISAGSPGIDIFATDGERYYAYTFPTDVQFCRPGGETDTQSADWKTWEELNKLGPAVREDFLTRNGLQSFTIQDFTAQLSAEDENHVCVRYYPYFGADGDTSVYYQLLLRQPARQGEGGIWAVDQWLDVFGNQYLYFPDTGKPAAEYYARLQEECDAGERPEYLVPAGAAMAFARDYFGQEAAQGAVCEEAGSVDHAYMERNWRLEDAVTGVLYGQAADEWALLNCVGEADAGSWGVLGRYLYGSDWFTPLMDAVADASIGEDQQARDRAVLSFYLATDGAQTDFHSPLSGILRAQKNMDPDAYQAALEEFSEEEQALLLGAVFGSGGLPEAGGPPAG